MSEARDARASGAAEGAAAPAAGAAQKAAGDAAPPGMVQSTPRVRLAGLLPYFVVGLVFGVTLVKSEAVSWFRIQEMFRFQSFHMYGIFIGALAVAVPSLLVLKRLEAVALTGERIRPPSKALDRGAYRYWIGGGIFGVGLALAGACPGPMFALLGSGVGAVAFVLLGAVAGGWTYGLLRPKLPH